MNIRTKFVIGENIRRMREHSGKSVAELCAPLGMSRAFWYDVEKGRKEATLTTLERIAGALGVNVFEIIKAHDAAPKEHGKPKRSKAS